MIALPVVLVSLYDEDRATIAFAVDIGEYRRIVELIHLRPEHNNLVEALKLITSSRLRDELDYELEEPDER